MTNSDTRRADAILAQFPGPLRLTPSPRKWGLIIAAALAFGVLAWVFVLRSDGLSLHTVAGWAVLAILTFSLIGALGALVPGIAYLTLNADGFETRTLFQRAVVPWQAASHFRVQGVSLGRAVVFNLWQDEARTPRLLDFLFGRRAATVYDNYGLAHHELARLMNEWRDRAVRED